MCSSCRMTFYDTWVSLSENRSSSCNLALDASILMQRHSRVEGLSKFYYYNLLHLKLNQIVMILNAFFWYDDSNMLITHHNITLLSLSIELSAWCWYWINTCACTNQISFLAMCVSERTSMTEEQWSLLNWCLIAMLVLFCYRILCYPIYDQGLRWTHQSPNNFLFVNAGHSWSKGWSSVTKLVR